MSTQDPPSTSQATPSGLSGGTRSLTYRSRRKFDQNLTKSAKRLQRELAELTRDPLPNISAGPKGNNIFEWRAAILGPKDSVYEGGIFYLDIKFNMDYPFYAPTIKFRTKIYHCNISSTGWIFWDILHENWSPTQTVSKLLLHISSLLANCNPSKSDVYGIGHEYLTNREKHDRTARLWTKRYAQ